MTNTVTERRAEENVGGEVRLIRQPRQRKKCRNSVGRPGDPTMLAVATGDHRRHSEGRSRVPGRKTAAIRERALVFEPGVSQIAARRHVSRGQTPDGMLHREADDLGVGQGFGREQASVLSMSLMPRKPGQVEYRRRQRNRQRRISAAQRPGLIRTESGVVVKVGFGVGSSAANAAVPRATASTGFQW